MWSFTYCGRPRPWSMRSFSFACAMSRATMSVPLSESRVLIGCFESVARISLIGRVRSISTTSPGSSWSVGSGRYFAGFVSSCSRKTPSRVIFALIWRSAEQETPRPTGHEAPWRGSRITRTSCAKYLPPNCAPIPVRLQSSRISASSARSRKARPSSLPLVGSASRYRQLASFTVLSVSSAEVPPDHEREVVGRAGRGAEALDLLGDEAPQRLRVQQRLRLLVEEGLVGRAAALGDE